MMFGRQLLCSFVPKRVFSLTTTLRTGPAAYESNKIGLREVVGFGRNGELKYLDCEMFPYPAIRFQEISPCYKALKEKEKGDWRSLTCEEKKTLYRISFCQTFAEMDAPSGEWKSIVGIGLTILSAGLLLHIFVKYIIVPPPLPDSLSDERRLAQFKRMIAFRANPIQGLASKWDYEKDRWK